MKGRETPWIDLTEHGGVCAEHAGERELRRDQELETLCAMLRAYADDTGDKSAVDRIQRLRAERAAEKCGDFSHVRIDPRHLDMEIGFDSARFTSWLMEAPR